jgi:hypothetical protein
VDDRRSTFAGDRLQVALSHPGVPRAIVFGAVAASLVSIIGGGLGGLIRHTAAATTTLTMIIVGDVILGQLLPAGLRQYLPGTAAQAAITVHRLRRTAHPRRGDRGPRRVRHRHPGRSADSGGAPRRLTNLTNGLEGPPAAVPGRPASAGKPSDPPPFHPPAGALGAGKLKERAARAEEVLVRKRRQPAGEDLLSEDVPRP